MALELQAGFLLDFLLSLSDAQARLGLSFTSKATMTRQCP